MKLLYFIVLTGLCMACHQPRVYRINGSLPGALDGYVVKLYNIDTYPDVLLDSTVIKDEKFQLEGTRTFEYPKYCRLVVDMTPDEPDQRKKTLKAYRFFADNTAMEFQCQMDSMPSYYWEPVNKEHNVTLTGSPTQDLYQAYKTSVQELSERKTALWNEYLKVYHVPALDGIFNTEKGMKIVRELNRVKARLNEATGEFIKVHNNSVVSLLLANNLLNPGGLIATRSLGPTRGGLRNQFGQRIIDSRLTIKNYTTKKEYSGTLLYGYYEVDGEGVTPEAEMTLVDKGVFKKMLNGRIPAKNALETTGSSRFMMIPQSPTVTTGTGTIHVQVDKGISHEKMKKVLIKAAKEAGQSCAYIVRGISGATLEVYRVDLKDGKEARVRATSFRLPDLTKLLKLVAKDMMSSGAVE